MKRKLRFLCAVLLLPGLLAAPSFAEDTEEEAPVGTWLGSVYTTDIVTYIDGAPIASYNIGGTTVVSVSDLAGYGFQVEWDPETRWVTVTSVRRPERMPEPDITREAPGTVRGSYYSTDIGVSFNGVWLTDVYNIGGWMMIPLSTLGELEGHVYRNPNWYLGYSDYLCHIDWDPSARIVSLSTIHPGDDLTFNGIDCKVSSILSPDDWYGDDYILHAITIPSTQPDIDPSIVVGDIAMCWGDAGAYYSYRGLNRVFQDQLTMENGYITMRDPTVDYEWISQMEAVGYDFVKVIDGKLYANESLFGQKSTFIGVPAIQLSVPFLLERNGVVTRGTVQAIPLFAVDDSIEYSLCLRAKDIFEFLN